MGVAEAEDSEPGSVSEAVRVLYEEAEGGIEEEEEGEEAAEGVGAYEWEEGEEDAYEASFF